MNFQDLLRVDTADNYLDMAFKRGKTAVDKAKQSSLQGDNIKKSKYLEMIRINAVKDSLVKHLNKILESFPNIRELPEFYQEMVKCTLEYDDLKLSLGIVSWAIQKIYEFYGRYNNLINRTRDIRKINEFRREFYGRVSSIMKQAKKALAYIEEARKVMKDYPNVKTSMKTITLAGFPNVGKTTLLYKLTGSKPEISSYAFTTKGINIGYIGEKRFKKDRIQVLDTPGTLDRFEKMNRIEKIAYLAMKHCSDAFVYVFDLTETYPLEDQVKLYERLKKFDKPTIAFITKTDITDHKTVDQFRRKVKSIVSIKELSSSIEKELASVKKAEDAEIENAAEEKEN